jgi:hypothetical protein
MFSTRRIFALAAALSTNVIAQTPQDFMPGTLVKLGVAFPGVNIDPAGTDVGTLDREFFLFVYIDSYSDNLPQLWPLNQR